MSVHDFDDQIFSLLACISKSGELSNEKEESEFTETYHFEMPYLPSLDQIENSYEIFLSNQSYSTALASMGFIMPFIPNMIQKISQNKEIKSVHVEIILYSYITWRSNISIDNLSVILNGLVFVLKFHQFEEHILKSLDFGFDLCFKIDKKEIYLKVIPILLSFFANNPKIAEPYQFFLPLFLKAITDSTSPNFCRSESIEFINFINNIILTDLFKLTPKTVVDLVYTLANCSFMDLDIEALKLFNNMTSYMTEDFHSSISSLIATPFLNFIKKFPPYLSPKRGNEIFNIYVEIEKIERIRFKAPFSGVKLGGNYVFVKEKTFENGMNISQSIKFVGKPSIMDFIRKEIHIRLNIIAQILSHHQQSRHAFFHILSSNILKTKTLVNDNLIFDQNTKDNLVNQDYFFDFISMFIFLYRKLKDPTMVSIFWDTVFPTILFDDRINIFQRHSHFIIIDQFRSLIFDSFKIDSFSYLYEIGQSFTESPSMLIEIISRISLSFNFINNDFISDHRFIQLIANLMLYFQYNNIHCDRSLISIIENTRSSLFLFIMNVFENSKNVQAWLSNLLFLPTFFSFLFEIPVRPTILKFIKKYIIKNPQEEVLRGIIQKIEEITSVMIGQIPEIQATELAYDLLQLIVDFNAHQVHKFNYFIQLIPVVCQSFQFLTKTPHCSQYLINAVSFLASCNLKSDSTINSINHSTNNSNSISDCQPSHQSTDCSIGSSRELFGTTQIEMLYSASWRIENPDPSPALFPKLVLLLAGGTISSANPSFVMEHPGILSLMASLYLKSDQFPQVYTFIKSLLKYSIFNVMIANNERFDLLLLDIVGSLKNDINNKIIITTILDLLCYMHTTASSKEAPVRFLSLLRPYRRKYLSPFESQFTQMFTKIVEKSSNSPKAWMQLKNNGTKSNNIHINGIQAFQIPKSFIIVTWIYLDQPNDQRHTTIFEIIDNDECGIIGFICSGMFLVTVLNVQYESTARFDHLIPIGTWYPITLIVEMDNNQTHLTASFGVNLTRSFDFSWHSFSDGPMKITLGSSEFANFESSHDKTNYQSNDPLPSVFISSFSIYSKQVTENASLIIDNGPRKSIKNSLVSIFLESKNGNLDYSLETCFENVSVNINCNKKCSSYSFCDILLSNNVMSHILPLFSLVDIPTHTNEIDHELPGLILDLLITILQLDKGLQQNFALNKGFNIVSFLLNKSITYIQSYPTYIRLYSSILSVIPALQKSITSLLLLNMHSIANSSRETQLRLSKHWKGVLINAYPDQFNNISPILVLIFEQFIGNEQIVNQIRQNLFEIVLKVSLTNLNHHILACLITFPFAVPEKNRSYISIEIIKLLETITKTLNSPLCKLQDKDLISLSYLPLYIEFVTLEGFILLLHLIILLHRKGFIHFISLQAHVEKIMRDIPSHFIAKDVILFIADLAEEDNAPELLPLCAYLAINASDEAASSFIDIIKPQLISLKTKFWLVVLAYKSSNDVKHKILSFLANCPNNDVNDAAYSIDVVSAALHDKSGSMIRNYIDILSTQLLETHDSLTTSEIDDFFHLASHFILFRRNKTSSALKQAFKLSPFTNKVKKLTSSTVHSNIKGKIR
ncbi:hypothetical protein TRFO_03076 [Tritrichomonas foetus]|uniref:DUF4704 domain-containing protein n=1 Tax=Tritrichomonas foetus TaxID=1144522 RepID=A0A1J4KU41_9EUKA|nr:hypothetical protein TRFO_03076 [Tritrichomonas foetus]|eukprot:OHT14783.1 hypothetical protein TRFO_03076 [Tritrichomonas foetus]